MRLREVCRGWTVNDVYCVQKVGVSFLLCLPIERSFFIYVCLLKKQTMVTVKSMDEQKEQTNRKINHAFQSKMPDLKTNTFPSVYKQYTV